MKIKSLFGIFIVLVVITSCNLLLNDEPTEEKRTYSVEKVGTNFNVFNIDGEEVTEGVYYDIVVGHVLEAEGAEWEGTISVTVTTSPSEVHEHGRYCNPSINKHEFNASIYKQGEHDVKDSAGNIYVCKWTVYIWKCSCGKFSGHSSTSHSYCDDES